MTATTTVEPVVNPHAKRIVLAHGGGGQLMDELLDQVIRPRFANEYLGTLDDSAVVPVPQGELVLTTDSYVVQPLEFPGGDIGRLAVSGTVNDLAVCGAAPAYITLGLILEEGLEIDLLRRVLDSAASTAHEAGVKIVTGDTKVVARGEADGMYINTAGVGMRRTDRDLGIQHIRPGDVVIFSGTIADHGLAVMLKREQESVIQSDLAHSGRHLTIDETEIPIRKETLYAAEMLGLDPLSVANEGKVVVVARPEAAHKALATLRGHPLGRRAAIVGRFEDTRDGLCELVTDVGGRRIIQKPYGEELPRIC
ncbi:MAG: HypE family hydrogenase expression/formation protein [Planctomycetota bacterium]